MTGFRTLMQTALLLATAATLAVTPVPAEARPVAERLRGAFPGLDLGVGQSAGRDAVARLGAHLPGIAAWYGKSADALSRDLLDDKRLRVDRAGRLLYVEDMDAPLHPEPIAAPQRSGINDGALAGLDQTFMLHSLPGSRRTLYLDFDGATITGTAWNGGGNAITAVPYDFDGNLAAFSTTELQRIQYIWQRVAEDYAPFDIDVTTQAPTPDKLTRSGLGDDIFGTTVVITNNHGVYACSCGGIAYVGVFNASGGSRPPDYYKPAFVFYNMLGSGSEKPVAEAISHEAGHNMGLHHDGTAGSAYYAGQGSSAVTGWAPIMGVGYYKPLVQFSKGEYAGANNREDDFAVAQDFGLPLRPDDNGNTLAAATRLPATTANGLVTGSIDGVIGTATDADLFQIAAGRGTLTASAVPAHRSANLDVALSLVDARGTVLAAANPVDALGATLTYAIPSQGTYYLKVQGMGQGNPADTGYSAYGSLGNFRLSVSHAAPSGSAPLAVIQASATRGAAPLAVTLSGTASRDDGQISHWYWDFGDGKGDTSGSLSSLTHVYAAPGTYLARLTVVDNTGLSATTTQRVDATASGPQVSVQSIQIAMKSNSRGQSWAAAVVTVVDQAGKPLKGAKVLASWSGAVSKSAAATTRKNGTSSLNSPKSTAGGCITLVIDNVTAPSYGFNGASQRTAQVCL